MNQFKMSWNFVYSEIIVNIQFKKRNPTDFLFISLVKCPLIWAVVLCNLIICTKMCSSIGVIEITNAVFFCYYLCCCCLLFCRKCSVCHLFCVDCTMLLLFCVHFVFLSLNLFLSLSHLLPCVSLFNGRMRWVHFRFVFRCAYN